MDDARGTASPGETLARAIGTIGLAAGLASSPASLTRAAESRSPGGPYAYVGTAFGPYAGFLSGVLLWITGTGRPNGSAAPPTRGLMRLHTTAGNRTEKRRRACRSCGIVR